MSFRPDTSRPLPCPHIKADQTCDACRGSRGCIAPTEFEMVPVSSQAAPDAKAEHVEPMQTRYMDEIDAGIAGERWLEQFLPGAAKMLRSDEPSGGQSVRVKWVVLLDRNDVLTYGYMLTRDIMNWTQLTLIGAAQSQAAPAATADAAPVELTDEQIDTMARHYCLDGSMVVGPRHDYWRRFARAILAAQTAQKVDPPC